LYTLVSISVIVGARKVGEAQNGGKIVGWLLTAITCGYFKDTSTLIIPNRSCDITIL